MIEKLPAVTEKLREVIALMDKEEITQFRAKELLTVCATTIEALHKKNVYIEDSLVAATTGELPLRYDLNQLLLAQRALAYIDWLNKTKDPRDKLRLPPGRPEGSPPGPKDPPTPPPRRVA